MGFPDLSVELATIFQLLQVDWEEGFQSLTSVVARSSLNLIDSTVSVNKGSTSFIMNAPKLVEYLSYLQWHSSRSRPLQYLSLSSLFNLHFSLGQTAEPTFIMIFCFV